MRFYEKDRLRRLEEIDPPFEHIEFGSFNVDLHQCRPSESPGGLAEGEGLYVEVTLIFGDLASGRTPSSGEHRAACLSRDGGFHGSDAPGERRRVALHIPSQGAHDRRIGLEGEDAPLSPDGVRHDEREVSEVCAHVEGRIPGLQGLLDDLLHFRLVAADDHVQGPRIEFEHGTPQRTGADPLQHETVVGEKRIYRPEHGVPDDGCLAQMVECPRREEPEEPEGYSALFAGSRPRRRARTLHLANVPVQGAS